MAIVARLCLCFMFRCRERKFPGAKVPVILFNNNNESISTAQNKKILKCAGWHKKFSVSVQMSEPCT